VLGPRQALTAGHLPRSRGCSRLNGLGRPALRRALRVSYAATKRSIMSQLSHAVVANAVS